VVQPTGMTEGVFLGRFLFCRWIDDIEASDGTSSITYRDVLDALVIDVGKVAPPKLDLVMEIVLYSRRAFAGGMLTVEANWPNDVVEQLKAYDLPAGPEGVPMTIRDRVSLTVNLPGIAWFDLVLNGRRLSQVPLKIFHDRQRTEIRIP
jgi:hypothetical protein